MDFGELFVRFLGVLAIDLILSGDNAVVIALAVQKLEGRTRRRAIFWGAMGAVVLRLLFAGLVIWFIDDVPLLRAVGGLLLIWIAWKLMFQDDSHENVQSGASIWEAIRIIVIADVVMSLDNVLALVAVSGESIALVGFGIILTIPLIVFGATILSALMDRMPWLIYLGSGVLIYVAVEMFFADTVVINVLGEPNHTLIRIFGALAAAAFIAFGYYKVRQLRQTPPPVPRVK
ncbi:MAG: TerC family protein [Actinomycetota bacterium]|jgi:YjbE family integral membrane protein|nr:TerC family protein [Rubrobacter sp.]MDQ3507012.1 TerC family protein [Actinomycetota bacterium]